jgi:hypothetical protein
VIHFVLAADGLILFVGGLIGFCYPKPPPLDFRAFVGSHRRPRDSLTCIVSGGALAMAGHLR